MAMKPGQTKGTRFERRAGRLD